MEIFIRASRCSFRRGRNDIYELDFARLNRFVGKEIPREQVIDILTSLEIKVEDRGDTDFNNFRHIGKICKMSRICYEEIIRMYGFENIENILPRLK